MGFLLDKLKPKKEIAKFEGLDTNSPIYKPFTLLQEDQLNKFVRGLLGGIDSLYDELNKKTGSARFTEMLERGSYKMKKGFEEYAYLGGFEALLCGMFPVPSDLPCSELEYGQGEFFNEQGVVVQYFKEEPLYERSHSKKQDGSYFESAGIVQILYQSPIGNFVIKQNQLNNRMFEIYLSEDISEMLLEKISKALETALDIKSESIEKSFRERYKFKGDSTSPNIGLQKPKDALIAQEDIEDSRDEI